MPGIKTAAERAEQAIEAILANPGASKAGHILFLTHEFEAALAEERARCAAWAKLYVDGAEADDFAMYVSIRDGEPLPERPTS